MKNASGSLKSQMLPSSLLAFFFKVLSLPQKFNRFQLPHPHLWLHLYAEPGLEGRYSIIPNQ